MKSRLLVSRMQPFKTSFLSPGILLLRATDEGGGKGLFSSLISSFFPVFFLFGLFLIPYREFCSPGLYPMVVSLPYRAMEVVF